jgi:hypothetical protein
MPLDWWIVVDAETGEVAAMGGNIWYGNVPQDDDPSTFYEHTPTG